MSEEGKIKCAVEWIAIISILFLTAILIAALTGEGLPCASQECLRLDRIQTELVKLNVGKHHGIGGDDGQ